MRVLIVEDDPDSSSCLAEMVRFWGYDTWAADSAAEARGLAMVVKPDVVLLDFQLPDVDGPELALELRQDPRTGDAFLVMITAFAFTDYEERALAAGIQRFMVKPVDYALLERILREVETRGRPFETRAGVVREAGGDGGNRTHE